VNRFQDATEDEEEEEIVKGDLRGKHTFDCDVIAWCSDFVSTQS